MMYKYFSIFILSVLVLVGCSDNGSTERTSDYEETKKMVVDIMKTDEGKKAIEEVLSEDTVKDTIIMNQETVTSTIEKNLTSDKALAFWEKAFKDPKFAASYAKSLEDEHKKVLKALMKDADYRSLLMEVLQDPEMDKELTKVIKSNDVREEMKKLIIETVDSPLVQKKLQNIILQAAEKLPAKSSDQKGGESQTSTGSGGSGGGGSGGQDNGGSGGSS